MGKRGVPPQPPDERFWPKVEKTDSCWLWTATVNNHDYGHFGLPGGRQVYAHRYAYERLIGPIPDGFELDHLCRVPRCVNPAHLEPVKHRTNSLRGTSVWAREAAQTHCIHGHPFDLINTYYTREGKRQCRPCRARRERERSQRVVSKLAAVMT